MGAWTPKGEFQHNWFMNLTAELWQKFILPRLYAIEGPINYIETGVADGQSLIWALQHFQRPGGLFVGVDPFLPSRNWKPGEGKAHQARAEKNLELWYGCEGVEHPRNMLCFDADKRPRCELHREDSQTYLGDENRKFHIGYVDGSHDAPQCNFDMTAIWKTLHLGGLLVVDDYERRYRGGRPQVRVACDAFEYTHWGYFDVLYIHPKQKCYVKVRRRGRRDYPPTLVMGPVIAPKGETGEPLGRHDT